MEGFEEVLISKESSLVSIIREIKNKKSKNVVLIFESVPEYFFSGLTVRILQKEAIKSGKNILFDTKSSRLKEVCRSYGIEIFDKKKSVDQKQGKVPALRLNVLDAKKKTNQEEKLSQSHSGERISIKTRKLGESEIKHTKEKEKIAAEKTDHKTGWESSIVSKILYFFKKSRKKEGLKGQKGSNFILVSSRNKKLLKSVVSFFAFSVSLVFLALFLAYPKAEIRITPESFSNDSEINFQVSKNISIVSYEQKIVPGVVFSKDFKHEKIFETKSFVQTGTKSKGKIRIFNRQTTQQVLIATTRFQTSSGLIFRIETMASIPPSKIMDGKIVPGEIVVSAYSDKEGEEYNVKAGEKLNVTAFSQSMRELVYGEVAEDFTGGTTTKIMQVSESEINDAKSITTDELVQNSLKEFKNQLLLENNGFVFPEKLYWYDNVSSEVSVYANQQVKDYTVKSKARIYIMGFKESDIVDLASTLAANTIKEDEIVTNIIVKDFVVDSLDPNSYLAKVKGNVSIMVVSKLDPDYVKRSIAGKTKLEARKILLSMKEIKNIDELRVVPSWFNNVPTITKNIDLKIETPKSFVKKESES